jgi:pyruvate kinase
LRSLLDSDKPWLWYTLGPATIDHIDDTLLAGATGVRYTFSYSTPELHIERARAVAARAVALGLDVYAIADLPGEKFRLASFPGEVIQVEVGDQIRLGAPDKTDVHASVPVLPLQQENFLLGASRGSRIVVGDGGVELRVEEPATGGIITCEVIRGGVVENNRGLTLVGGVHEPRSLTETDLKMLEAITESNIFDAVALSFLSDPDDLKIAREIISSIERPLALVAKIETLTGVERSDEICQLSDVVMAARGDLALAIDPAMLYAAVSRLARSAVQAGVPWLLATQLLEGLDHFGFPTRAELTDIVGWMERGAAGAMLSRETVFGGRPVESIKLLRSLLSAPHTWEAL